jgi:hypothetical protein
MLPTSYSTAWGPGALYAELYIGMCRALAAPWLSPWMLDSRPDARSCPPAKSDAPSRASAAEPPSAGTEAVRRPDSAGALIIPFDRARAGRAKYADATIS